MMRMLGKLTLRIKWLMVMFKIIAIVIATVIASATIAIIKYQADHYQIYQERVIYSTIMVVLKPRVNHKK